MKVGIIMGSDSDLKIMQQAEAVLHELGVETEMDVMSAHRPNGYWTMPGELTSAE